MAAPETQGLLTEDGLFIITESGDFIVTETFTEGVGGKSRPSKVKEDNSELWEIGTSVNRINDNSYREPITIKKYITEENNIKVTIGENVSLHSLETLNEIVTAKLLSNKIREW